MVDEYVDSNPNPRSRHIALPLFIEKWSEQCVLSKVSMWFYSKKLKINTPVKFINEGIYYSFEFCSVVVFLHAHPRNV
jgi:hypothetical protein